ncbi:MAG: hypothetical protein WB950_16510, partial [Acidobacteriaceae bacterium]
TISSIVDSPENFHLHTKDIKGSCDAQDTSRRVTEVAVSTVPSGSFVYSSVTLRSSRTEVQRDEVL